MLAFKPVDVKVSIDSQTTSPELNALLSGVEWLCIVVIYRHQKWWRNVATTSNAWWEEPKKPLDKNTETGGDTTKKNNSNNSLDNISYFHGGQLPQNSLANCKQKTQMIF